MPATVLKEKAIGYFSALDDRKARMVISYMEAIKAPSKDRKKNLGDLKGKIKFADGYDYKAMRSSQ